MWSWSQGTGGFSLRPNSTRVPVTLRDAPRATTDPNAQGVLWQTLDATRLGNSSLLMPHTCSRALLPPAASVQPQQIESCRAPSGLTEQLLVLGNQVKSPRPLGLDSRCFIAFLSTFADAALRDDISKPRCRSHHCQDGAARLSPTTTALSSLYPGLSWWHTTKLI